MLCIYCVHVVYMWCTYRVHMLCIWCTYGVHVVYMWFTSDVYVVYKCTFGIHVVYMRCPFGVHVVYMGRGGEGRGELTVSDTKWLYDVRINNGHTKAMKQHSDVKKYHSLFCYFFSSSLFCHYRHIYA